MSDQDPHGDTGQRDLSEVAKSLRGALEPQPEAQAFFASPDPAGGAPPPDVQAAPAAPPASTQPADAGSD